MKRNQPRIFALIHALLFLIILPTVAAAAPGDFVGTWYLKAIETEGTAMNPASLGLDDMVMVLEEGNIALMQAAGQEDERGTWSIVDGQVIIESGGSEAMAMLTDHRLTMEQDGVKLIFSKEKAEAVANIQPTGLEGLSLIELMQWLTAANIDMNTRDRAGDTPLYRIDNEHFVSEEDVAALLNVLTVRRALQQVAGFRRGPAPTAEAARDFLIRELLLAAKARELGYTDLEKDVRSYIQEGWLQQEPPMPDASDTKALVQQGLMRARLWRNDLLSAQDTQLPFKDSVLLIDALVEELYEQFISLE